MLASVLGKIFLNPGHLLLRESARLDRDGQVKFGKLKENEDEPRTRTKNDPKVSCPAASSNPPKKKPRAGRQPAARNRPPCAPPAARRFAGRCNEPSGVRTWPPARQPVASAPAREPVVE